MSKALWPLLVRFFKFGVVGGSGVVVNLGLYALLTRACGLFDTLFERGLSYAVSVEISIITNFTLSRRSAKVHASLSRKLVMMEISTDTA